MSNKGKLFSFFLIFFFFITNNTHCFELSILKQHGIKSVPLNLIQTPIDDKQKSIILIHEKDNKRILSIIKNEKRYDLEPSFSVNTAIINLELVGNEPKLIHLKTDDKNWISNNYWDLINKELFFVSKKISSSKVYKSKNLKKLDSRASYIIANDDILNNKNIWSKKVNLVNKESEIVKKIEEHYEGIGHSGKVEKFYRKVGSQDYNFISEVDFIKKDGFVNDLFLSYQLLLFPNYNKATYAYDAGSAHRGDGAYLQLGYHLFKIEKSCGITSCILILEKDGKEVYMDEIKNVHYNQ